MGRVYRAGIFGVPEIQSGDSLTRTYARMWTLLQKKTNKKQFGLRHRLVSSNTWLVEAKSFPVYFYIQLIQAWLISRDPFTNP